MVSFSEETKDDINWDMLDDVARCQIKKLSVGEGSLHYKLYIETPFEIYVTFQSLIDYLSQRSGCDR